jgi:hypothetical protein
MPVRNRPADSSTAPARRSLPLPAQRHPLAPARRSGRWATLATWLLAGALAVLLVLLIRALVSDFWVIVIAWSQP